MLKSYLQKPHNKQVWARSCFYFVILICSVLSGIANASLKVDPVKACVIGTDIPIYQLPRDTIAACLGWERDSSIPLCHGTYHLPISLEPIEDSSLIEISANKASIVTTGKSKLTGNVKVRQSERILSAETAYIFRDDSGKITKIDLQDGVYLVEPDKFIVANKISLDSKARSGEIENVLFRFNTRWARAISPAWGWAQSLKRLPNEDYELTKVAYTTCPVDNCSWLIEADKFHFNNQNKTVEARNVTFRIHNWPVFYTPYISFSTVKERKSGFLMPLYGYSNIGGADFGFPYYWNMAPNYDSVLIPHVYTRRGLMLGGKFRYLTENSSGTMTANILPQDRAFGNFLDENRELYPRLNDFSSNRWYVLLRNKTRILDNMYLRVNFQQVSDDYYLQDFSTNLAILTQNQLLRQVDLTYNIPHWYFRGMLQSYQTLHPINQSDVSNIYERLPQLIGRGTYEDLPFGINLNLQAQFDKFRWAPGPYKPQGLRYHATPVLYKSFNQPWGYITPKFELVENYYDLNFQADYKNFNRTIPRYSVDSGLTFERQYTVGGFPVTQTLEPRLFYLNVPFHEQNNIPNFDSAYMIFTIDQLFRNNRFSGFDRISDANQLTYAFTTRWLSDYTGKEFASFSIGQIKYFQNRRVNLCYDKDGICNDNEFMLGYLSHTSKYSPIASRLAWQLNPDLVASAEYTWDPYESASNNANVNLYYKVGFNRILSFNYNYLVNGEINRVDDNVLADNSLSQATFAYAWPFFSENLSTFGVYSYNLSKRYDMITYAGLQYDNCCWAFRVLGGRTFKSLNEHSFRPEYNSNFYIQVVLKGLGTASSGDPVSVLRSYLPGYVDVFRN